MRCLNRGIAQLFCGRCAVQLPAAGPAALPLTPAGRGRSARRERTFYSKSVIHGQPQSLEHPIS